MFDEIKAILVDTLSIPEELITPESKLDTDLGVNSLELAELASKCEDDYGVTIEDTDLQTLITVGDVADYIESHRK